MRAMPWLAAALVAVILASVFVVLFGAGYAPFALLVAAVGFLLTLAIALSLFGRWHPAMGAAGTFILLFLLLTPAVCAGGSNGTTHTTCAAFVGLTLPGYSGTGDRFSPSPVPSLVIAGAGSAIFYLAVRRRYRSSAPKRTTVQ